MMKKSELQAKMHEHKIKTFNYRLLTSRVFLHKLQVIEQLESLFEDAIDNIHEENDVFECDAYALWFAINYIKRGEKDEI